jgi:signal transduction histidine kinase
MGAESMVNAFLDAQGYAIFEYLGGANLRPLIPPPSWCRLLLGEEIPADGSFKLDGRLPFLENFLFDAEEFWTSKKGGRAESGSWIERGPSGEEIALEAFATWLDGKRILVIQNPQKRYDDQFAVLQKAREGLLEHERLLREVQKKEILLHCIVHDLSQPLTAIRGSLSLLGLMATSPEMKELVEIGVRQSLKQETMIRGILQAFSAELQSSESFDPSKAPDLAQCAKKIVEDFQTAFRGREVALQLDPKLDLNRPWFVVGDEPRLLRIFGNLAENALRHVPPGTAVTLRVLEEDRYLRAVVDDQGPGLPQEISSGNLFGLFTKGKGESGGKAGLGLYFCKITVERWGGSIGCENGPEGGARFWFTLPRP